MNDSIIFVILTACIILLIIIVIYQYILYHNSTQNQLHKISSELKKIVDSESTDKVMMFTDNKALIELLGQINRVLEDRQRITANYRRSELSSKKMLSNISHDIKTPMTVILGYLEIMRINSPKDQTLIAVEKKAAQVMSLINQFFTLAKLEAGDTNVDISKINMNEICQEAILDFYEILTKNNFQVEVLLPKETIYANGNQDALNRILFNLISNVVRYGSNGKYIAIRLSNHENLVFVEIIDHGKGIDKAFANSVFERLYTMEDSRNRNIQGNGLGLTIAKNLAIQMGGDIQLKSEPGIETIFTLQLNQFLLEERKK